MKLAYIFQKYPNKQESQTIPCQLEAEPLEKDSSLNDSQILRRRIPWSCSVTLTLSLHSRVMGYAHRLTETI